jgi:hypothetical protein
VAGIYWRNGHFLSDGGEAGDMTWGTAPRLGAAAPRGLARGAERR